MDRRLHQKLSDLEHELSEALYPASHHQYSETRPLFPYPHSDKMVAAAKYGSSILRLASPAPKGPVCSIRTFSTTLPIRAPPRAKHESHKSEPVARRNPLIGSYVPAPPPKREPKQGATPTSTEHPRATSKPSPDRASSSSAEAPPNFDLPPPPPPPPPRGEDVSADVAPNEANPKHSYSATNPSSPLNIDIASIIATKYASYTDTLNTNSDPTQQPNVRPATVTGRVQFIKDPTSTVRSNHGAASNLQTAVNRLERAMTTERVKSKWHYQKFHERPGLKRKRLRSERWRKRFKEGFQATSARVRYLQKQGW